MKRIIKLPRFMITMLLLALWTSFTYGAIPIIDGRYEGMLYTGEINPIIRTYKCQNCNRTTAVGIKEEFPTIEELKNKGCPKCKMSSFTKISEKKREEF